MFFSPFSIALPRLGKSELILVLFERLFNLCLFGFVGSSASWCLGGATVCDCGTPWAFLVSLLCKCFTPGFSLTFIYSLISIKI